MKRFSQHNRRGLTLTELLVVMLIIGLLATIAVPVYVSRMEDARVRVARGECREIAQTEEQCALIHGYYVPFQLLDDKPQIDGITSTGDSIDLEPFSNIYLINPLIPPQFQQGSQRVLSDNNTRIRNIREHWQGPFLNPQRVYTSNADPKDPNFENNPLVRLDFPLDPWGEAYRFYSPLGLVGSSALQRTDIGLNINFSDGLLTNNDNRNFPRYAVVSWGRDNLSELVVGVFNRDDVSYLFGTPGVESTFGLRDY